MQETLKKYKVLNTSQEDEWNKIVKSFADWEVFYLVEYNKCFEVENKETPLLFYYEDEKNRGFNVFMKRDISKCPDLKNKIPEETYFDISSQYGYGGFIIEGDAGPINNVFQDYCIENNIISEIVRFGLFNKSKKNYYGEVEAVKPNIVRKINMPLEDILKDFEYKVRKNLKRAQENNLQIHIDEQGESLETFIDIYYKTMNRNNAKSEYYFSKKFFEMLIKIKENIVIFNVIYNDNIISTEMVLYGNEKCYSFLGGTLSEYFSLRPNDFIKFEIIKWAYRNKLKYFVLGGGYTNSLEDGILKYKKSFAPKDSMIDFCIGKKIFNEELYKQLVNTKEVNFNSKFFPLYRG